MTPEEFVVYVDNLPDACIDKRTAEEVIFHLPKKKHTCPACGSQHTTSTMLVAIGAAIAGKPSPKKTLSLGERSASLGVR